MRMQLFGATMGNSVLWCNESWALREDEWQKLLSTQSWKRLDGSELDGSEHFEKNCQNVPGAAGAAVGAAAGAAAAAASAVCILSCTSTYPGVRSAPLT